jgi:hypothetical protein
MATAMFAGTYPDDEYIEPLIHQCGIDPDFFVRDTLSWALTRQNHELIFKRLTHEIYSVNPQSVSQALHTYTKLNDPAAWPLITKEYLLSEDENIARTAWRAASRFVPDDQKVELANLYMTQLGRGSYELQLQLSKAICVLALENYPGLIEATKSPDEKVRNHALFTMRLQEHPEQEPKLFAEYSISEN